MNDMTLREELRTYSKSDLARIKVLATRKQYEAEQKLKGFLARFWSMVAMAAVLSFGAGAGAAWWFLR